MIHDLFNWCVWVLEVIGEFTGMGYELANIVIFVIAQPALIILFYILWRNVKKKILPQANKGLREKHADEIKEIWDAGDKAFLEGFNAPIDQDIIDMYPELNDQKKPIKTK